MLLNIRVYKQDKHICYGFRLYTINKYQAELWYCPKGLAIIEHKHSNEDIELMFLFGHNTTFYRRHSISRLLEFATMKWYNIGKTFTINNGHYHSFSVSKLPLVFINFETWLNNKPTSACDDFELLNKE